MHEIRNLLAAKIPRLSEGALDCVIKGPLYERENSRIFSAECPGFEQKLAIKLCRKSDSSYPDAISARRQFDALQRAYEAMAFDPALCVPRPYLLDETLGLIAVEWIAGTSMTDLLFSSISAVATAERLVTQAGTWLRRFHDAHPLREGKLDVEQKLPVVLNLKTSEAARDVTFGRALEYLASQADVASSINCARSWIHGDFKTDNLIVGDRRTIGIDIHVQHENVVLYDLAQFLNHLDISLCYPKGWRHTCAHERLYSRFVASYCNSEATDFLVSLRWVRLYLLLTSWPAGGGFNRASMRRAFLRCCYKHVTANLLRLYKNRSNARAF